MIDEVLLSMQKEEEASMQLKKRIKQLLQSDGIVGEKKTDRRLVVDDLGFFRFCVGFLGISHRLLDFYQMATNFTMGCKQFTKFFYFFKFPSFMIKLIHASFNL